MIIDGNGNVGINTITPSTRLEVAGTISSTTFVGNGTIPVGGIIMWSGSIASIPAGWALCDGSSGTPDLRSKFIIGASTVGPYTVGASGGSTTIEASNLPKHAHYIVDPGHSHDVVLSGLFGPSATGTGGIVYVGQSLNPPGPGDRSNDPNAALTNTTGITISQNGPILDSNYNQTLQTAYLQPYYSLAYIMRTV
jgi:microcystin-dependent protein